MLKNLNNEKLEKIIADAQEELEHRTKGKETTPESPFDQTKAEKDNIICMSRQEGNGIHFMFNANANSHQLTEHVVRTIEGAMEELNKENPLEFAIFAMRIMGMLKDKAEI